MTFPIWAARRRGRAPVLIFSDVFTTNRAAGAVDGTASEPGTATRSVNDPDELLSISSGSLVVAGQQAVSGVDYRPGINWGGMSSNPAKVMLFEIDIGSALYAVNHVGWYRTIVNDGYDYAIRLIANNVYQQQYGIAGSVVGSGYSGATTYRFAIMAEPTGGKFWAKGGAQYTNWTLLHTSTQARAAVISPVISFYSYETDIDSEFPQVHIYTYVAGMESGFDNYFV